MTTMQGGFTVGCEFLPDVERQQNGDDLENGGHGDEFVKVVREAKVTQPVQKPSRH